MGSVRHIAHRVPRVTSRCIAGIAVAVTSIAITIAIATATAIARGDSKRERRFYWLLAALSVVGLAAYLHFSQVYVSKKKGISAE